MIQDSLQKNRTVASNIHSGYLTAAFELFGTVYEKDNYVVVCFSSQRGGRFIDTLSWVLFLSDIYNRISSNSTKIFVEPKGDVDNLMNLIAVNLLSKEKRKVYQRWEFAKEDKKQLSKDILKED